MYIFNRNWVDTWWQQYSTHLHTITEEGKFGKCGPCPIFASYTLVFALQLRKKYRKTSVRVAKYKNNELYNTQKKNSNREKYNVTEQQRTQNIAETTICFKFVRECCANLVCSVCCV
jgi:hypothetical protein